MSSKKSGAERLRKSKERKKEVSRETSRRCRENSKGRRISERSPFPSRMAKKQKIDDVREKLPKTPEKKAAVLTSLINSPQTRKLLEESGVIL